MWVWEAEEPQPEWEATWDQGAGWEREAAWDQGAWDQGLVRDPAWEAEQERGAEQASLA